MNIKRRFMVLGIPLLLLLGCRPDPVYVVERVDGGGWVRTLSPKVAQESLLWQVEESLSKQYGEEVATVRSGLSTTFLESGGVASEEALTEVTSANGVVPAERLSELLELWASLERFALPVDHAALSELQEGVAKTAHEMTTPSLLAEDRKWVESGFKQPSSEGVVDLSNKLSELTDKQHVLWKKRFEPALEEVAAKGLVQFTAELKGIEETFRALQLLAVQPRMNPHVKTAPTGAEDIALLKPPTMQEWASALRDAGEKSFEEVFRGFIPKHPQFWKLSEAYLKYRGFQEAGGWEKLSSRRTLKVGHRGKAVTALRARLVAEGFDVVVQEGSEAERFDKSLSKAVKEFQRQHYLGVTGKLDERTRKTLNKPVEERLVELGTTLWKWSTSRVIDTQEDHIFVNIAGFYGQLWRGGEIRHPFKVAVGKARRRKTQSKGWHYPNETPELHSMVRHVVMNPKWNIPSRILKKEILPKVEKDPTFAEKKHYVLEGEPGAYVSGYQTSGPWNALGRVKFIFPNKESVYLHDTPGKGIFKRSYRAASHGCIRVENALELAQLLLGPERRWRKKYEEVPEEPKEQWIGLKNPVPVFLESYRVWVDDEKKVYFSTDLYKKEKDLVAKYTTMWSETSGNEARVNARSQDTKR